MEIIIKGIRGEGKSTLAELLVNVLLLFGYNIEIENGHTSKYIGSKKFAFSKYTIGNQKDISIKVENVDS